MADGAGDQLSAPVAPEAKLIAGHYRVVRRLKQSAGVSTFLAQESATGAAVVVKVTRRDALNSAARLRLSHEAKVLQTFDHPCLCPLLEFGEDAERIWLVQPCLPGRALRERLAAGQLRVAEALTIGADILRALACTHELGVLHRDIKPANVLLADDGGEVTGATLIDFGLARSAWLDPTVRDQAVGSARYLSPEASGLLDLPVDERSDLYSLGVLLFEALVGHTPFDAGEISDVLRQHLTARVPDIRSLRDDVPSALNDIVQRLLRKDPGQRYQSAAAALADVEALGHCLARGEADPALLIGASDLRYTLTEASFIGRATELTELQAQLEWAAQGTGVLVLLEGDSGAGKTRLLAEFASRCESRGAWVLRGQGVDQTAQRPFQLLEGVAEGIAGAPAPSLERLRGVLGDRSDAVAAALPRLREVLHRQVDVDLPEAYGEIRSVQALVRLIDALAPDSGPAVIVLDDCQWADAVTLRVLTEWCRQRGSAGVLLVVAFRGEEVGPAHQLRALRPHAARHIKLGPFTEADTRNLLRSMAGPLPAEVLDCVTALCEGSPFMAQAVLRGLVESKAVQGTPDGWRADPIGLAEAQTSQRAAVFLARRLALLSANATALVSAGAVLGKQFDIGLALELAALAPSAAITGLDESRRRRILWLDEASDTARFTHDKLREAVLATLPAERRAAMHLAAAERLQQCDAPPIFDLAYHFDAAGRESEALRYALAAAEQARSQHSLPVAEHNYRIAQRWAPEGDREAAARIAEGLGDTLALRGNYPEARQQFETARSELVDPLSRAAIDGKLGDVAFRQGEQGQACAHLHSALRQLGNWVPRTSIGYLFGCLWEVLVQVAHCLLPRRLIARRSLAGAEPALLTARLYSRLAYVYWFRSGKVPCAWAHLREMNLAERYPATRELAQAYSEHAPVMTMIPWFSRGVAYAQRSLAMRRELGDVWGQGQSLSFYGVVLYAASRYRECIEACLEAVRILNRTGDQWEVNTATWHIGFARYRLGELEVAAKICEQVYRDASGIGDQTSAGIALGGWARAAGGWVPMELIERELRRDNEDVHTATEVRLAKALRALATEHLDEAIESVEGAWQGVRAAGLRQEYVAPALIWRATTYRRQVELLRPNDPARRVLLRRALRAGRQAGRLAHSYRNNLPHALRERGRLALLAGRPVRARRLLARSITAARSQSASYELAQSLAVYARQAERLGWPDIGTSRPAAEAELAELTASFAGSAADSSRLPVETLSLADRFDTLQRVGRTIASAVSAEEIFQAVRDATAALLRAEHCSVIAVHDPQGEDLASLSDTRLDDLSRRLIAAATRQRRVVIVTSNDNSDWAAAMALIGVQSALCAPVTRDGEVVACFYVTRLQVDAPFGPSDDQLASFIADLAGAALEQVAGSEARYRALIQNAHDVTAIFDQEANITYLSPGVHRLLGYQPEELVGRTAAHLLDPADAAEAAREFALAIREPARHPTLQLRARHRDGSWRWLELAHSNLLAHPLVRGMVVNIHDVTERKQAELELANATQQFRVAFDNAPIGMALTGLRGEDAGRLLRVNRAMAEMLGCDLQWLAGRRIEELTHPDDIAADRQAIAKFAAGQITTFETEKRYRHRDGRWVWVHLSVALVQAGAEPVPAYVVSQLVDITERRRAAEQLAHLALHDALTGLPNRRLFTDHLTQALARSERSGRQLAVLYLDVDRFKVINDSLGHEAGDQVLVEISNRLQRLLRSCDTLARLGGDEFVLIAEEVDGAEEAGAIAQRLGEVVAVPIELSAGASITVTASIGIAMAAARTDAAALLRDADTAMYQAKAHGRHRHEVFEHEMRSRAVGRLRTEAELREAIGEDRLVLHYQPIVELLDQRMIGVEALLRYRTRTSQLVWPDRFIGVAEESGLIVKLGDWVLRRACQDLAARLPAPDSQLRVAVNVSPRQLMQPGFAETVAQALRDAGLPGASLSVEVTEAALLEADATTVHNLKAVKDLGVQLGIDDFGTGYASLSYLRRFPVDLLKIDRSFVSELVSDPGARSIVAAVIGLGGALGLTVVAEGVETVEQAAELARLACPLAQGFLFGRPGPEFPTGNGLGEPAPVGPDAASFGAPPTFPQPREPGHSATDR